MKYKVLVDFTCKETKHVYRQGDKYPVKGRIRKARVEELLSSNNMRGQPLICAVDEEVAND
ncbi:hypothetical protein GU335_07770 [Pseudolactococcus raffinolactis]|uniref:hypothetical protein n=1 Tax=Pseudolactococcus raffinolactis TaxID=1366 RepID=UPI001436F8F7|nr:hypothetical protein [Lactococcus raffinolactis]QIW56481.1 hypothetical protein GU335_07770 [Lactococcus raffinolactis]